MKEHMGAYGLRLAGLEGAEQWMQPQAPDAPLLRVVVEEGPADESPPRVDEHSADIRLIGGARLRATRGEDVVRFTVASVPPPADLLHPYLAPAAALAWQWRGHEALHAGAICAPQGAVVVLGVKEAGKSTTMAWLSRELATPVLADDLVVIHGPDVLAGPRSIDLRPADQLAEGSRVRAGERVRITLPSVPPRVPLAGTVVLTWGERMGLEQVAGAERLRLIAAQRSYYRLESDPAAVLELAAKPMVRIVRPRAPQALEGAARALLEQFS